MFITVVTCTEPVLVISYTWLLLTVLADIQCCIKISRLLILISCPLVADNNSVLNHFFVHAEFTFLCQCFQVSENKRNVSVYFCTLAWKQNIHVPYLFFPLMCSQNFHTSTSLLSFLFPLWSLWYWKLLSLSPAECRNSMHLILFGLVAF